jgi:hypothetical protein
MLSISQLDRLQALLLQAPALVERLEQRDPEFTAAVKAWLGALEAALQSSGLPAAGLVAASRSTLISAERDVVPGGLVVRGQLTGRKIRDGAAAMQVRESGELVAGAIQRDRERVAAAETTMRQAVSIARAKGLIQATLDGAPPAEMLSLVWKVMAEDADLMGATVNVEGLVGPQDALVVLGRTLAADLPAGWTFVPPKRELAVER